MKEFKVRTKQPRKKSEMKSVKKHNYTHSADDLFGCVRESFHGHRFNFDALSNSLIGSQAVIY